MNGSLVATTRAEGLKPLGSQAQRSFDLIQSEIESRLGPDHAALFAEPVSSEFGDQTDWYATRPGRPIPLAALDEAEQAALRQRLAALVDDIRGVAAELAAQPGTEPQRLGDALANALEIPSEAAIHALRDGSSLHPVLVDWARIADVQSPVRGLLTGASRARAERRPVQVEDGAAAAAADAGRCRGGGAGRAGGAQAVGAGGAADPVRLAPVRPDERCDPRAHASALRPRSRHRRVLSRAGRGGRLRSGARRGRGAAQPHRPARAPDRDCRPGLPTGDQESRSGAPAGGSSPTG